MSGRHCPSARHHHLVEQVERMALVEPQTPPNIATLCRLLAVSEKSLRKAFHRVHGIAPHRYLQMLRFSRARQKLMLARDRSVTVTEIATCLGFFEFGRFSTEYRKMFGESPSETLRQAVHDRGCGNRALNDRWPPWRSAGDPDPTHDMISIQLDEMTETTRRLTAIIIIARLPIL